MTYRERRHRLLLASYQGQVCVAFTLCVKEMARPFVDPHVVNAFRDLMSQAFLKWRCASPGYVFMPDHQHVIVTGLDCEADTWKAVGLYKQRSGYWFSKHQPAVGWQKDFYDHILRTQAEILPHIRYVLENPVRKGFVDSWEQYPFKGSIGCNLNDVLLGLWTVKGRS